MKFFNNIAAFLMFAAFLTTSCGKDVFESSVDIDSENRVVTFTVNEASATRGSILTNDTFNSIDIYVVNSDVLYSTITLTKDGDGFWVQDGIVKLPTSGTTTFYAVGDQCAGTGDSGVTFNVGDDGVGYVSYAMPSDVASQPTLVMSAPVSLESDALSLNVELDFYYTLAIVGFTTSGDYSITSLSIENFYSEADITFGDSYSSDNFSNVTLHDSPLAISLLESKDFTDVNYLMIPLQNLEGAVVKAGLEYNGTDAGTKVVTLPANEDLLTAGYVEYYNITTGEYVAPEPETPDPIENCLDYTASKSSNCYIVNPGTTKIIIPVEDRINTFWGNVGYNNDEDKMIGADDVWTTEILWTTGPSVTAERVTSSDVLFACNDDEFTNFTGIGECNSAMLVTIPSSVTDGNCLIAVKKGDVVVWSWHLWVTDYDPDGTRASQSGSYPYYITYLNGSSSSTSSPGNALHRYLSDSHEYWSDWSNGSSLDNVVFMMDRNLGTIGTMATGNYDDDLYYQFGRKDPFIVGKFSKISAQANLSYAAQNPTTFFYSSSASDWVATSEDSKYTSTSYCWRDPNCSFSTFTNDTATSTEKKSIFDPSPLGWKVPHYRTWENFHITTYYPDHDNRLYNATAGGYLNGACYWGGNGSSFAYYYNEGYISETTGSITSAGSGSGNQFITWSTRATTYSGAYTASAMHFKASATNSGMQINTENSDERNCGASVRPMTEVDYTAVQSAICVR